MTRVGTFRRAGALAGVALLATALASGSALAGRDVGERGAAEALVDPELFLELDLLARLSPAVREGLERLADGAQSRMFDPVAPLSGADEDLLDAERLNGPVNLPGLDWPTTRPVGRAARLRWARQRFGLSVPQLRTELVLVVTDELDHPVAVDSIRQTVGEPGQIAHVDQYETGTRHARDATGVVPLLTGLGPTFFRRHITPAAREQFEELPRARPAWASLHGPNIFHEHGPGWRLRFNVHLIDPASERGQRIMRRARAAAGRTR